MIAQRRFPRETSAAEGAGVEPTLTVHFLLMALEISGRFEQFVALTAVM